MTPQGNLPLSIAFGATTLEDCVSLALAALGGKLNVREASYFDMYGGRSGTFNLADVSVDLFQPNAGTVLQLTSTADREFAVINPPSDSSDCWLGLADLRESPAGSRVADMVRTGRALFITIGIEEAPLSEDGTAADERALDGARDYALVVARRQNTGEPFQVEINFGLLEEYPDAAWIANIFSSP